MVQKQQLQLKMILLGYNMQIVNKNFVGGVIPGSGDEQIFDEWMGTHKGKTCNDAYQTFSLFKTCEGYFEKRFQFLLNL